MQMGELSGRLKQEETKVSAERAQHNAATKDLMLAQEEVLELKRRVRVAVRPLGLGSAYARNCRQSYDFRNIPAPVVLKSTLANKSGIHPGELIPNILPCFPVTAA